MASKPRLQPLARAVLHTQTDERLVALARRGKEAAFAEIVRRYRSGLVAFAAAYGPPDAEDVVQESFVSAWRSLSDSSGEMHLKAWLYTIVRNRALNARRDTRVHEPLPDELDGVRQPAEIVLTNEELDRVVGAVAALPDSQREALVRSALEGHTHDQIAAALGSTPGAVRQLIYRARLTVRHGVGLIIPLPLVALLAEIGAGAAGAAGAAAGATAAGGAAGGASIATKVAIGAAVGAVAVGSGVAVERSRNSSKADERPAAADARQQGESAGAPVVEVASSSGPGSGGDRPAAGGAGPSDQGSDDSGRDDGSDDDRDESDDDDSSAALSDDSDDSGPGSDDSGSGSDDSGHGSDDSGSDDSGSSGSSGSGSSGSGGSGSSGHGGGSGGSSGPSASSGPGGGEAEPPEVEVEEDNSGPGGGGGDSSGSGGGGESGPSDD